MKKFSSDFVLSPHADTPPEYSGLWRKRPDRFIPHGVIIAREDGSIYDVLPAREEMEEVERFSGILCPGFVNTHCHLELSHLRGKVPQKTGLIPFLKNVLRQREAHDVIIREAMWQAENEMMENGIVAVGDVCNGEDSFAIKAKERLRYYNLFEVYHILPEMAQVTFERGLRLYSQAQQMGFNGGITPHAPYTVSRELMRLIRKHAAENQSILSIHNQESPDENEFFLSGTGGFSKLYGKPGTDISSFIPTGKTSLTSWLKELMPCNNLLLVHNTFTSVKDIAFASQLVTNHLPAIYWCFCPRANLYIEDRLPEIEMFRKAKARIVIGTDSLASNTGLSVLEEIKVISAHAPDIPLGELLCWATQNGAEALGMEDDLGSFEKGKRPGIVLIENADLSEMKLVGKSSVRRIM